MAEDRILITGGAGFIGVNLADGLRDQHRVVLFDKLCHDPALQRRRAAALGVELVEGDVTDADALAGVLSGCSRVVHLASLAGVERVCSDPIGTMRTVLLGVMNLLDACRAQGGIERVVIVSTSEVYGPRADRVAEDAVCAPLLAGQARWTYAAAKLAAEHLGLAFRAQAGVPVVVVRPFNVYGPGQLGLGAVRTFVEQALDGLALELHGGGDQVRAWCFVDDLCDGLRAALFEPSAVGRVYNLGNQNAASSIRELAGLVVRLSGSKSRIVSVERPGAEVAFRVPDIGSARRDLGFEPRVDLEAGLLRTLDWYRRQGDAAKV